MRIRVYESQRLDYIEILYQFFNFYFYLYYKKTNIIIY